MAKKHTHMITTLWQNIQQRITSRSFVILVFVYLLGLSSMIRANRFYLDDLGRTLYGYADWLPSARPLAEALSWLFYLGPKTLDASPLTQLLAIGILALTSLLLLEALRLRPTLWALLCTVPIGLSPYGLENLSYKFDAPGMAFGLLCAVAAACLLRRPNRPNMLYAALLLFASTSFYQPALGAFLAICAYAALQDFSSRKRLGTVLRRLGAFTLPFIAGVGVYVLQAPLWFVPSQYTDYVEKHANMPELVQLPGVLHSNVATYLRCLVNDWTSNSMGRLFALVALLFCLTLVARWVRSTRAAVVQHGMGALLPQGLRLLALGVVVFCFLLTPFGIQLLLESPVWTPRTFYGFGVMLALMLLQLHIFSKGNVQKVGLRIAQGLVVWQVLVFAQVYGNLLENQNDWELTRMTLLAADLNAYITQTGNCKVAFVGSLGSSPLNSQTTTRYPLLGRLVTVPLTSAWRWGYEELKTFGVTLEAQALSPALATQPRKLFAKKPGYSIEEGPNGIGIITFQPMPVARPSFIANKNAKKL